MEGSLFARSRSCQCNSCESFAGSMILQARKPADNGEVEEAGLVGEAGKQPRRGLVSRPTRRNPRRRPRATSHPRRLCQLRCLRQQGHKRCRVLTFLKRKVHINCRCRLAPSRVSFPVFDHDGQCQPDRSLREYCESSAEMESSS